MINGAKQRAQGFKNKTDGTYNAQTGKGVKHNIGYQVSFVRPKTFERMTDDEYDAKVAELIEETGSDEYIGVWGGVVETSFHVKTKEQAIIIATKHNQDGIWDWEYMEFVPNPKQNKNLDD